MEPVMVGEALGIDQFAAQGEQAMLKAFRLGNPAQGSDLFVFEKSQTLAFPSKDVLEIERVMNAFDNAGGGVVLVNAAAQFLGYGSSRGADQQPHDGVAIT